MSNAGKYILGAVIILLLAGGAAAFYYLSTNTDILNGSLTNEEYQENTFNNTNDATNSEATNEAEDADADDDDADDTAAATNGTTPSDADLTNLVPVTVDVPEQFRNGVFAEERQLYAPNGFSISVYAAGLDAPRFFDFNDNGTLVVADKAASNVVMLPDRDGDGAADEIIEVDSGLKTPHSVQYDTGALYLGEEHQIVRYSDLDETGAYSAKDVIIPDLPAGFGHSTRTVLMDMEGEYLYVSIGSSCNVCDEDDERRASVMRYNLDGSGGEVFASGLRNTVGLAWRYNDETADYDLYGVDNGRDWLGDDLPPEELNLLRQGWNYGWPTCYGDGINNPEYPDYNDYCAFDTAYPAHNMQAHSAPLGLTFMMPWTMEMGMYPSALEGNGFTAFHGSWNRATPTGYKVVRLIPDNGGWTDANFITGWLDENGNEWGRPVGVGFDGVGVFYISDDAAGAIYRVTYDPTDS